MNPNDTPSLEERIRSVLQQDADHAPIPFPRQLRSLGTVRQPLQQSNRRIAIAAAMVIAVALIVTAVVVDRSSRSRVVTSSPPLTVGAVRLPAVAHPAGWKVIDFGRLRLWMPPRWVVEYGPGGCTNGPQTKLTIEPKACGHPLIAHLSVRTGPTTAPHGWRQSTIHGLPVWTHHAAGETDYVIPRLNITMTARGALAGRIARTLGASSLQALLTLSGPVTIPSTWKTVTYDHFSVEVPPEWPTTYVEANCGYLFAFKATAYTGEPKETALCPALLPETHLQPANGVWLTTVTNSTSKIRSPKRRIGNVDVAVQPVPGGVPIVNLTATAHNRTLTGQLGLGTNPITAEEILSSLHYNPN